MTSVEEPALEVANRGGEAEVCAEMVGMYDISFPRE